MTHDHRLVASAGAAWAAAVWWTEQPSVGVVASAAVLIALAFGLRRPAAVVPLVVLCALAASIAWRLAANEASPLRDRAEKRDLAIVTVQLLGDGREVGHVSVVDAVSRDGRIVAFVPESVLDRRQLIAGSRWVLRVRLEPAESRHEAATARVIQARSAGAPAWWWTAANRVRDGVRDASETGPADGGSLVPALTVGDDSGLDPGLSDDFRRSGLTHLLAVSGTNLTIVLAAAIGAGSLLGVRRRGRWLVGAGAIIGFVLVARPEPSVLRAAAMGAVGIAAFGIGSRGGIRALSVAVIGLVFIDPWLSRSAGFVLSVCATAGIIVLAPPLRDRLSTWMPRWAALAIAIPTAAQVACTPALVALSGEVSVVAVAANILVAPAVAPATVLGLVGGLVNLLPWIGGSLGALIGCAASWCAQWIVVVGRWCGGMAGAGIDWPHPWWVLLAITPVVGWCGWRAAREPGAVLGLVTGLVVVIWRPPTPGWPPDGWVMVACDVGQGDATVLALDRPGDAVVVDTGPDDAAVHACLQRLGVERVRLFVVTHGDADHAAGWRGVARGRHVDQALIGVGGGRAPAGVPVHPATAGESFDVDHVSASVLWPPADARFEARNDASIVLRVETRGVRVLLTGDLGAEAERRVVRSGVDLSAQVLKFPHHGSKDQDATFLAAAGPVVVTISVGADNGYGHPAPEALAMLRKLGTTWWRTDQDGDIAIVVDDGRIRVVTRH